jgi:hypothetical protein
MTKHKIKLFLLIILFFIWGNSTYAAINFTLTPLKYEIDAQPWDTITRVAQIRNNWDTTVTLPTAASDFQANDTSWTPSFVRKSELVFEDQQLSSWITIDTPSVTLAPWETKWFSFDIDIPLTATPWGHYGAVFFKHPGSESSTSWNIGINVDYGIIILLNVAWEVIVDVEIDDVIIDDGSSSSSSGSWWGSGSSGWWSSSSSWGWGWGWGSLNIWIDNCPFWDLTASNFDGKCIDNPLSFLLNDDNKNDTIIPENTSNNDIVEIWEDNQWNSWENNGWNNKTSTYYWYEDFEISFTLPINNNGNTHVKPDWKIKLIDEDWKTIQWVWKEIQINDFGAVIGEEIVDYLPLNDEGWNILPKTKRNFKTVWKGFPFKTRNERWDIVIEYQKPWEYYTNKNFENSLYKMPWQRVEEARQTKKIQAIIDIAYEDADWQLIEYNSAEEFEVQYTEQYLALNPYILIIFWWIIFLFLLWWFIAAKRKVPCINEDCDKRLKRNQKRCPKCDTLQKEKKKKKKPVVAKKSKKKKTDKKK